MYRIRRPTYRTVFVKYTLLLALIGLKAVLGPSVWHSHYTKDPYKIKEYRSNNILESQKAGNLLESRTLPGIEYAPSHRDILALSQLVSEAEIVHAKLNKILSDYYFRLFRVNLDSKCRAKQLSNSCSSQKSFISLNKNRLNTRNGLFDHKPTHSTQAAGNGGGHAQNGAGCPRENGSSVQKCHVDRCNSSEIPFSLMRSKRENYVLRFSESSLSSKRFSVLGFSPEFFERSHAGSDNYSFVDLLKNPPSYTGYDGRDDWKIIYGELDNFENISCRENLHFYKLMTGMQSAIYAFSALNYECTNPVQAYEDQTELPSYQSNYTFYLSKLSSRKDRLEDLYYTYKYVLAAVVRLKEYLCDYTVGLQLVNHELYLNLKDFISFIFKNSDTSRCDCNFNSCNNGEPACEDAGDRGADCCTSSLIDSSCGPEALEKFNKLIELVDCVDCEKCRLHGKLKLSAIQTAIRIHTCPADKIADLDLERNDLVALLHGLDYFTQSVLIVERFEQHRKRQIMLYPLRILLGCLLVLIVVCRRELVNMTSGRRNAPVN